MNSKEIVLVDFDNVLYFGKSSSALEDFLKSYQNWKAKLFYPAVVFYLVFTKAVGRITGFKTGETTVLSALDLILRKHPVPYHKIEDFSEKAAGNIDTAIRDLVNQLPEVYIITSEPVQLVDEIIDNAGLNVKGIYGNEFEIGEDGKIHGFKRYSLLGGMSGKYYRTSILLRDLGYKPTLIYAVGDSIADKGINGYLGVPVVRYEVKGKEDVKKALEEIIGYLGV